MFFCNNPQCDNYCEEIPEDECGIDNLSGMYKCLECGKTEMYEVVDIKLEEEEDFPWRI